MKERGLCDFNYFLSVHNGLYVKIEAESLFVNHNMSNLSLSIPDSFNFHQKNVDLMDRIKWWARIIRVVWQFCIGISVGTVLPSIAGHWILITEYRSELSGQIYPIFFLIPQKLLLILMQKPWEGRKEGSQKQNW